MAIVRSSRRPADPPDVRLFGALLVRRDFRDIHDVARMHGEGPSEIDAAAAANRADEPRVRSVPAGRFEGEIGKRPDVEPARVVTLSEEKAAAATGEGASSHEHGPLLGCPASMD